MAPDVAAPQKALCPDHWRLFHQLSRGSYSEHCWTMRPDGLPAHVPVPDSRDCANCHRESEEEAR